MDRLVEVAPEVISHNIETVERLTREVRIQSKYQRSLEVLRYLKESGVNRTKSGLMLGLGETEEEVIQTIHDLRNVNVDTSKYQGYAFGMGIDRLAMLKYGIPDLRSFFDSDIRWLDHYGFDPLHKPSIHNGL